MSIDVLGLSGSLREASLNTRLVRALKDLAPAGMRIETATLHGVPLYDGDLEAEGLPESVTALAERIAGADALIIASPEYNYSLPGVLKNGIDWLSRVRPMPFTGKPLAIMGATPGRLGTSRMQYQLRHALLFTEARVLTKPEVMLGNGGALFDAAGALVDAAAVKVVRAQLDALAAAVDETRRLRA